jgi:hypothetical protein
MPAPEHEEPNQLASCRAGKQEHFHAALDRALTAAERAQEQVQAMRTRLDIYLLLLLLAVAVAFSAALGIYSYWQASEPWPSSEPSAGTIFMLLRLLALLAPGVIIGMLIFLGVERLKSASARDSTYVKKVADVLREAVKPDDFPTRLEWHLFQMRLSRFDIGAEGRSDKAGQISTEELMRMFDSRPAGLEAPASGQAKARP